MKNKFFLIFLVFFWTSFITSVWAFTPSEIFSWLKECHYKIDWTEVDWSIYNTNWVATWCNNSLNFWTDGLNIPDWSYSLTFKAVDNATNNSNVDNTITENFVYKFDTVAPICTLEEINLGNNGTWNNQFYKDWNLYYRQNAEASGSFSLKIKCTDIWNTSWIVDFIFPKILWVQGATNNYTWAKDISLTRTYNWQGSHSDAFNLLSGNIPAAKDQAGNIWYLKAWINTKVILNWTTIENVTSLNLIWDSSNPITSEQIQYKSWNEWNWAYTNLFKTNGEIKYFSALEDRKIKLPAYSDDWSWINPFEINIERYNKNNNETEKVSIDNNTITHNFSRVNRELSGDVDFESDKWYREYNWDYINDFWDDKICDNVWNCINLSTPWFRVVANVYNLNKSWKDISTGSKISNYNSKHESEFTLKDEYWNYITPVNWVKNIEISNKFTNTLWLNQITSEATRNKWDWVWFEFKNLNGHDLIAFDKDGNQFKSFSWNLTKALDLKEWVYKINLKSAVPTYSQYTEKTHWNNLYWNSWSAKLSLNDLVIKSTWINGQIWIWEEDTDIVNTDIDFEFEPVLTFWIDDMYPIIEWQRKNLTLTIKEENWVSKYDLITNIKSNNWFININDLKFDTGTTWSDWNIIIDENDLDWNQKGELSFIPKTSGWIENDNTKIALFSNLKYVVSWLLSKEVSLPWIQTWLSLYWIYDESNLDYSNDDWIIFAEIDIKWITQTNNALWDQNWDWATTTDNNTYDDFSKIELIDIKRDINKNVTDLVRGIEWINSEEKDYTIQSFNFNDIPDNSWVKLKWWDVIYFKNKNISLNCWETLENCEISWKKTIVIENWTLTINSDMYYKNSSSILGIILIWNTSNWDKSQLLINEEITNGVWVVYSDGPVMSVNKLWNKYYTDREVSEWKLKNQLLWEWSFITRNTVWGSIKSDWECPYWTPHYENWCDLENSQAYDLIYLRRYATSSSWNLLIPVSTPAKIAWWIEIDSWWINKDANLENLWEEELTKWNKTSPFILKYDSRIQTNPPYGFEK